MRITQFVRLAASAAACAAIALGAPAPALAEGEPAAAAQAEEGQAQPGDALAEGEPAQSAAAQAEEGPEAAEAVPEATPTLVARAHVQDVGWQDPVSTPDNHVVVGTSGLSLRVEALELDLLGADGASVGGLSYRAHVENVGWEGWVESGGTSGSTGSSQRLEALRVRLSDELEARYDLWYRVHVQDVGWMGWTSGGELAGTSGYGLRMEAVELWLLEDGSAAPEGEGDAYVDAGARVRAHVQDVGWQEPSRGFDVTVGTSGRSLRMEALRIDRPGSDLEGDVRYEAHVQDVGWQGERANGQLAGTEGESRRIEALRVWLTGELGEAWDVWYRLHVQDVGWMGWAADGEPAGTEGLSLRVEAVQIALVPAGSGAPAADGQALDEAFMGPASVGYRVGGEDGSVAEASDGGEAWAAGAVRSLAGELSGNVPGALSLSCDVRPVGGDWAGWASDGERSGAGDADVEAVRLALSGPGAGAYRVWYRSYVRGQGWQDWAQGGLDSGSSGVGLPVEAVQALVLPAAAAAPGGTARPVYTGSVSGDAELDAILDDVVANVTGEGPDALWNAYIYVSGFPYASQDVWPAGGWRDWSVPYAKQMYRNGAGNCYRYASLMCWIARRLGYDASVVAGEVLTSINGRSAHGWTEIHADDGNTYIIDCNLHYHYPDRDFFWYTYQTSPVEYYV